MTLQLALDQIQRPTWWFEEADRAEYKNQWTQSDSGKIKKQTVLAHIRQAGRADCGQIRRATGYTTQSIRYVTGARISDVLSIKVADWTADGLLLRQKKTGKLQLFRRTPIIEQVIDQARRIPRPVRGLYLLCTLKGQPYKYSTLLSWWERATTKAGVVNAHFHDIRGKAATDGKRDGIDYQALLGHSTKAMSDRYIKIQDAQIVEPMRKIL
jgi:integrase